MLGETKAVHDVLSLTPHKTPPLSYIFVDNHVATPPAMPHVLTVVPDSN